MTTFSAQVSQWVQETEERLNAVRRLAIQKTFNQILTPWPVDTGFSKNSFTTSLTGFAPLVEASGAVASPPDYNLVIAGSEIGDTIYANFTANYAVYIEYGSNGRQGKALVRMAAQNWQKNVTQAVREVGGS